MLGSMRVRKPVEPNRRLEALLDERDHLHVQISLEADAPQASADRIDAMSRRLRQVDADIVRFWKRP